MRNKLENKQYIYIFVVYQKTKMIPGSIRTFWYKCSAKQQGKSSSEEKGLYVSEIAA